MKRIVASVGLVALGASSLQTASAQGLSGPDASKPWNVSATLRGFYDDNINSVPDSQPMMVNGRKYWRGSSGFEVTPSAGFNWDQQQTKLSLTYALGYKYFDKAHLGATDNGEITHTFGLSLSHAFDERWKLNVDDSFGVGQEPDTMRTTPIASQVTYVTGNNIRNYGSAVLDGQLTPLLGTEIGYDNTYYHYQATGAVGDPVAPDIGRTLNRDENAVHLEGRYFLQPETYALLGFRFRDVSYNSDKQIAGTIGGADAVMADARNSRFYAPYVGLEHNFTPQSSAGVRIGANYADYYNDTFKSGSWSPYVNLNIKHTYAPDSYVSLGFTHDMSPTDVTGNSGTTGFAADQESSTVYGSITHQVTAKIVGSLMASFQDSSFNGGAYDGKTEQYFTLGANLEYKFNPNLSTHIGYNYDKLSSDLARGYDRNRVYVGLTASY